MGIDDDNQSWSVWRTHVLAEIKRANDNFTVVTITLQNMSVEMAKLQVKAGVWGLIAGSIPVIIMLALQKIK